MTELIAWRADRQAARDVLAERNRQIHSKGYDVGHDDAHPPGSLARLAAVYTVAAANLQGMYFWPDGELTVSPRATPRENLVRAGALILAELERLDRVEPHLPLEAA